MNPILLSAWDLATGLKSRQWSAVEVTQSFVDQILQFDSQLNAFLRFDPDKALEQARRQDQYSTPQGLAGLPVAVKDVLCIRGEKTSCASKYLECFESPYDATAIEKLRNANAVLLGQTNMDEFAMGSSNENSAFGPVNNPWNIEHVPGGSSGGAAACVAARMAPLSLGSDTGGSVRQPAAFCGVTGLKPTYGRISRFGLVAFASSLDQVGILAHDARDVALGLEHCSGHDPRDSTSAPVENENWLERLDETVSGLKIGIPAEYLGEGLDPQVRSALASARKIFEDLEVEVVEISLPMTSYGVATYYLVASCEASGNLARYDGAHYGYRSGTRSSAERAEDALVSMYQQTRSEGFGPEVKRRIMLGTYALSSGYYEAYYLKALKTRRLIRDELRGAFQEVDLILGPTTPTTAYRIGEKSSDPLAMYLGDIYTVVANLAGIPAISFPAGLSQDGLPIGLQLQAPAFRESRLLRAVHAFQKMTDWHSKNPPMVSPEQ